MRRLAIVATLSLFTLLTTVPAVVNAPVASANCPTAGCPAPVPCNAAVGACWKPAVNSRWQYQLQAARTSTGACNFASTGGINVNISAVPVSGGAAVSPAVFDIDFLTDALCAPGGSNNVDNMPAVNAIHAKGARAICYLSAGTAETFRPDYQAYATFNTNCGGCLFGKPVGGFRNEFWLNINNDKGQRTFILNQISARLDRCKADGFDAVEFDNVDAYQNRTGLSISADTQLLFNTALANLAHSKGLTAALKNDLGQLSDLKPYFDFAMNEQCFQFKECDFPPPGLPDWTASGKAVFNVEYRSSALNCPQAATWNINSILKTVDLFDTPWTPAAEAGFESELGPARPGGGRLRGWPGSTCSRSGTATPTSSCAARTWSPRLARPSAWSTRRA